MKKMDYYDGKNIFPAHINESGVIQSVQEHCIGTAEIVEKILEPMNLSNMGKMIGILHDMGKFTNEFSNYIKKASNGERVVRGSVNHTFAGVRFVLTTFREVQGSWNDLAAEIVAYSIGAHHGLFDCVDEYGKNGFIHRLKQEGISYEEAVRNFFNKCITEKEICNMFSSVSDECEKFFQNGMRMLNSQDNSEIMFYMGITVRLVLSALIDGDRIDTECFMLDKKKQEYFGTVLLSDKEKENFWKDILCRVDEKIVKLQTDTDICKARRTISDMCSRAAQKKSGIYRLNIPTGGGKTLASLRYALNHARIYGKDRIIIVTPLLSIIDQNVEVIREVIGDDSIILEHHSNIVQEKSNQNDWDKREMMLENWDSPIILTTLVQLLNTIFSGKTSSIRRFHALCNSVIVLDEVQTVPMKLQSMFNLAMNYISYFCDSTVILCSATQPCFEYAKHPMLITDNLIDLNEQINKVFERTRIIDLGMCKLSQIHSAISDIIAENESILVVCNNKTSAMEIFFQLKERYSNIFYLSSSLCLAHRRYQIDTLKKKLKLKEKVICISTQVIEAGVDISFSCAVRFTAGLDNIIQVAGRCNRNGEYGCIKNVYVITCIDEKLNFLQEIDIQKQSTIELLHFYNNNEDIFNKTLFSKKASDFYYKKLYVSMNSSKEGYFDCYSKGISVYDLLSSNSKYADSNSEGIYDNYQFRQAFKKAADLFNVFEDDSIDVLVPYGEGIDIINELNSSRAQIDHCYKKELLNKAKEYSISLYSYQIKELNNKNGVTEIGDEDILVIKNNYYNDEIGLDMEGNGSIYLEV